MWISGTAAATNPDSNKSTTQEIFDKGRRENDAHTEGPLDKVSGTPHSPKLIFNNHIDQERTRHGQPGCSPINSYEDFNKTNIAQHDTSTLVSSCD